MPRLNGNNGMMEKPQSVMKELKQVEEALRKEGSPSAGINRLLNEWDVLKTLVGDLRDEIRDLKTLLTEERKR